MFEKKGNGMPHFRINMVDFKSNEDMLKDMDTLQSNMKSLFPEIRLFISMEASETSNVGIAVYDDKEAADRAVEKRNKHMAGEGFSDNFSHEGKVIAFYAENEKIEDLVKVCHHSPPLLPSAK